MGNWFTNAADNLVDGYKASGEMFASAANSWRNGEYTGAIYEATFGGVLGAIGNTITFGGAHALGEKLSETTLDKIEIEPTYYKYDDGSYMHGYKDADGVIHADETKDENGRYKWGEIPTGYTEYHYKDGEKEKLTDLWLLSNATNREFQHELASNGKVGTANVLGFIDDAGLALDIFTGYKLLDSGRTAITGKIAQSVTNEAVGAAAKGTAEVVAETSAKVASKEAAEVVAEGAAKEVVKDVAKNTAETVSKDAIVNAVEESLSQAFKKSGIEALAKSVTRKSATTTTGLWAIGNVTSNVLGNGKIAYDLATDPVDALASGAAHVAGAAGNTVGDVANDAFTAFLNNHKGIAKVYTTCRAAVDATNNSLKKSVPGSYLSASCSVAAAKFDTWATGHEYKYAESDGKKSIGDVAENIRDDAKTDTRSWSEFYKDRVQELDKKYSVHRDGNESYADVTAADGTAVVFDNNESTVGSSGPEFA